MPQPMNILTLTDETGATVLVNADRVCMINPLPTGSKIIFNVNLSIQVRETPTTIRSLLPTEPAPDERHNRTVRPRSGKADQE